MTPEKAGDDRSGRPTVPRAGGVGRLALVVLGLVGIAGLWRTIRPTPGRLAINLVATYLFGWLAFALTSRRSRRALGMRFALMTCAIGLTLALIELPAIVGLVDYLRLFPANRIEPFLGRRDRHDPELGTLHPPHLRETGQTQGDLVVSTYTRVPWAPRYPYEVRYDAQGFRNTTDLTRADIAVIGDSFVEGAQVPFDALMTTVLGRVRNASVANLGQIKYGPREELAVLRRFAVPLRPRICVWAFFEGNDLVDLRRYDRVKAGAAAPAPRTAAERSFTRNALIAAIRVAGLDRSRYDAFMARSGSFQTAGGEDVRLFFLYPGAPLSDEDRDSLRELAGILAVARDTCRQHDSRLVVVFIPTKFRVYGDRCRFAADSPCRGWTANDLPEMVRRLVADVSPAIGFLDLTAPFREQAPRGPLLYYPDDTHWSPEGQALAGRLLADYLATLESGR